MLTWIVIDSKAIRHNIKQFRRLVGPDVLLMPVIKANAYGHGFFNIAKICQTSMEVDRICVVNINEAIDLINSKIKKPILILSFFENDENKIRKAIKNDVVFPLYNLNSAKTLNKMGERLNRKAKVHLKIDTGTSRIGILPKDVKQFVSEVAKLKNIEIEGIFSHFSSSEQNAEHTKAQHKIFKRTCDEIESGKITLRLRHISCSAAIIIHEFARENAVRLGLSLYGIYPNHDTRRRITLKPALSWYTTIIQVKNVPTGTSIGYGETRKTTRPTKLAVLPVGYWDGYDRRFSNNAYVLVKGHQCPIIGRICMNLCMVDVTGVDARNGEKVVLIGKSGNAEISIDDMSKWANTINYELIDRINPLLPRITK